MAKKKKVVPINKLPLKKQAKLLFGNGYWRTHGIKESDIHEIKMNDGPCGLRTPETDAMNSDILPATCFPAPCLSACSWDTELMRKMGHALAVEAIEKGTDLLLAPGINIKRNPLCGRNFEYLSEDPLLSGEMGAAYISGLQDYGVGACLKHFAANNCEYHRFTMSSEVDMRALREIYLKGFEIAIKKSHPWSVMCSYNRLNGVYASQNEWLLDTVLRKEWGYDGVLISDWCSVVDPVLAHARGLDLEMPSVDKSRPKLIAKAIKKGKIDRKRFDEEVTRIAALSKKVDEAKEKRSIEPIEPINAHQVAKEMALNSIVLAKNDGILPLKKLKDVCIIGAFAKEPHYRGAGSAKVKPKRLTSFYQEASKMFGADLPYAKGYDPKDQDDDEALRVDAIDLASTSKTVILFLGTYQQDDGEGYDRHDMRLDDRQVSLFEAIYAQNKNIIVVLSCGSALELPFIEKCRALMIDYLSGEAGGEALLSLIMGEANPSGHLAESWPIRYIDCPSSLYFPGEGDVSLYKESIFVGYRYYLSAKRDVLFPFGYGLSYTDFALSDGKVSRETLRDGQKVKVSIKVKNVGKVSGATVVQCYIGAKSEKTLHALRELKAFEKVFLAPGKSKTVTFEFAYSAFAHYGVTSEKLVVNDDDYSIDIGLNCRDISFSKTLKVVSSHHSRDMHFLLPGYFSKPQNGAWRISDNEFEVLLDHSVSKNIRRKKKKFHRNNTIKDLERTLIGKYLKKKLVAQMTACASDYPSVDMAIEVGMNFPLRSAILEENKLAFVIHMANHRPIAAIFRLIFG